MASATPVTDHDEIREWVESRGGRPACVKGTGGAAARGLRRAGREAPADRVGPVVRDVRFAQPRGADPGGRREPVHQAGEP